MIVNGIGKSSRYENKKLLSAVRRLKCVCCENEYSEAAHADMYEFGKGFGVKASDAAVMALCTNCHIYHGNGNKINKDEKKSSTYYYIVSTYNSLFMSGAITSLPKNIEYDDEYYKNRAHQIVNAMEGNSINIVT